jgi:glutaminase
VSAPAATWNPVADALDGVLALAATETTGGRVADYIPELAGADPAHLGIAVVSVHGTEYGAGDATVPFTVQSVSKPFVYALAVVDHGLDAVHRHVGCEPSGDAFNAISLDRETGRPSNPMINAGAIVTSALVDGADPDARSERIQRWLSAFAGRELEVDETVYASERTTGDRNRALAYLARAAGVLPRAAEDAVDVYFRQCAVRVTAADLAVMGATLANGGVNPCSGETVTNERVAEATLALMASCGMYDYAGEWMLRVGLPAKSGVGGGIVAVQPGQFGIGTYSPPLDARGNSVRGVHVLTTLSRTYGLHLLAHPREPLSPVERLVETPDGAVELVLRGELDFLAAERLLHALRTREARPQRVGIDLASVTRVQAPARRLLAATVAALRHGGATVTVHDPDGVATTSDDGTP